MGLLSTPMLVHEVLVNPFTPKFKKNISEVVRIGSIIIFNSSKLWKAKFFILCDVIFLVKCRGKL